jgi:tripartite-type tricarboxylate transporter receptor subunit TctC
MKFAMVLAAALLAAACGLDARAQGFPNRAITIVVPYAPGGPTDAAARAIGEHMSATLSQSVVIENVSGGGGTIAVGRVARAAADGHTLLIHQLALAANVTLLPNLPYDTEKDLVGVGLVNFSPMVLLGRNSLPAKSLPELAAWMKQNGPNVKFAHAGSGSLAHLCAAIFAQSQGFQVNMIPYRGGAPALTDVIAGHSDVYCSSPATAMEQIKGGLVRAYGVTSPERMAALPDVPSAVAAGFKELDIQFWQGLFAPTATPSATIQKLNSALQLALTDAKVLKSFADTGMSAFPKTEQTAEFATLKLRNEIKRWGEVIRSNKIEQAQ